MDSEVSAGTVVPLNLANRRKRRTPRARIAETSVHRWSAFISMVWLPLRIGIAGNARHGPFPGRGACRESGEKLPFNLTDYPADAIMNVGS